MSPSDLPEATRSAALEIIRDLLHDWIKYMEMRLLSIDWANPTDDVQMMLRRGIEHTRRLRGESNGVRELWAAGRKALAELPQDDELDALMVALDGDVEGLTELLDWDSDRRRSQSEEALARVRRPGIRLRAWRESLSGDLDNPDSC